MKVYLWNVKRKTLQQQNEDREDETMEFMMWSCGWKRCRRNLCLRPSRGGGNSKKTAQDERRRHNERDEKYSMRTHITDSIVVIILQYTQDGMGCSSLRRLHLRLTLLMTMANHIQVAQRSMDHATRHGPMNLITGNETIVEPTGGRNTLVPSKRKLDCKGSRCWQLYSCTGNVHDTSFDPMLAREAETQANQSLSPLKVHDACQ